MGNLLGCPLLLIQYLLNTLNLAIISLIRLPPFVELTELAQVALKDPASAGML